MCGIVGVGSVRSQIDTGWLSIARDSLRHRGPDGAGEWWSHDRRVGLAHRRLSVIDLSATGNQPMHSYGGDLTIVFNGEIYNHRELRAWVEGAGYRAWRGHSDTEVLLACLEVYGLGNTLSRVVGMFAFALHDARSGRLILVRDRAGEKPLYYRIDGGTIWFASELKALLANRQLPRQVCRESLDCYLAIGYVPGGMCILDGYRKLPPAHVLDFDTRTGVCRVSRYWEVPRLEERGSAGPDGVELLDELETLLHDAVGQQLCADVPVGLMLSGGIDSSLVAASAAMHGRKVTAFSVGFPGHGHFDETQHARTVTEHLGLDHCVLEAEPISADLMSPLAIQFDEPIADSSMIPTSLVSRLIRQHCTVALSGDGGDELFGGYGYYSQWIGLEQCSRALPRMLRRGIACAADFMPMGARGRHTIASLGFDTGTGLPSVPAYFDRRERSRLLGPLGVGRTVAEQVVSSMVPSSVDLIQRATRRDFESYLPDDILVKVDRASMLHSLEVRAPLLDRRIVEFAFGRVPSALKATRTSRKILLKRLARRLLPGRFDVERKQGFSIPLDTWLRRGPFRDLFWDVLSQRDCPFRGRLVRALWTGQESGRSNSGRLFALVQLELWRRAYSVSL